MLAALPLGVDFALGYFSVWDNNHLTRVSTGALLSSVAVFFIMPGMIELSQAKWLRSLFRKPDRRFYLGKKAKDVREGVNLSQLVGMPVSLMISDPWDFGTECGVGPFYGKVTDSGTEKIADEDVERALVTLDRSILYSNTNYLFAMCHVRHEGASLEDLEAGSEVSVNITLLPNEAKTLNDIDGEDFSRGFAAIGSLQPV